MSNVVNIRKGRGGAGHRFPFLDRDYNEAVRLLQMTSSYLEGKGKKDVITCSLEDRVLRTVATSHIIVQLTSVLSWLMALKALVEGDITEPQMMTDTYNLQRVRPVKSESFSTLPDPIPSLIRGSAELYEKTKRIEENLVKHWREQEGCDDKLN